jgi:hypothetical protein
VDSAISSTEIASSMCLEAKVTIVFLCKRSQQHLYKSAQNCGKNESICGKQDISVDILTIEVQMHLLDIRIIPLLK